MFLDIDTVNRILDQMSTYGVIEPIDEVDCHPLDWAEVVGISDEIFEDMYPEAKFA